MKRFWVFVIICVVALGVGFTVFRFMSKDELIYVKQTVFELNSGENIDLSFGKGIVAENLKSGTIITVTENSNGTILEKVGDYEFTARNGGTTTITVTSNKTDFLPVTIQVTVGDGLLTTPFFIRNATELANIGKSIEGKGMVFPLTANYKLVASFALPSSSWVAIGADDDAGFRGTFDFNGHQITNLNVASTSNKYASLFSKIGTNGYIKGANLKDVSLTADAIYSAAVAGINLGRIENAVVTNVNIANGRVDSYAGGIVGRNSGVITKSVVINNSTSKITATSTSSNVGGIAGCSITTSVDSTASISRCSSKTSVAGSGFVGGVVGKNDGAVIENCYAGVENGSYTITGGESSKVGGIAGSVANSESIISYVADTYSVMNFTNTSSEYTGQIIGQLSENSDATKPRNVVYGNYYSSEINTGLAGVQKADIEGVYPTLTANLKKQSTYSYTAKTAIGNQEWKWQFAEGVWTIGENTTLPELSFVVNYVTSRVQNFREVGDIYDAADFKALQYADDTKLYTLKNNIVLNSDDFTPFDFNGKFTCSTNTEGEPIFKITLVINSENGVADGCAALFKTLGQTAQLTNIKVEVTTNTITNAHHLAAIAANNYGSLDNCRATGSITTARSAGDLYIGGLVAENNGNVINSSSLVALTCSSAPKTLYIGGLVGLNQNTISNSTNSGAIIADGNTMIYAGGVAGYSAGVISSCASNGSIEGNLAAPNSFIGGITAYLASNAGAKIVKSASYGPLKGSNVGGVVGISIGAIDECYSNAPIQGVKIGGLAYNIKQGTVDNRSYMRNCMTDGSILYGEGSNAVVCGVVYQIDVSESHLAYCEKIFSSSKFSGDGSYYYETVSNIRGSNKIGSISYYVDADAFNNSIYVERAGNIIRSNGDFSWSWKNLLQWDMIGKGKADTPISEKEAKGSDGFSVFTENNYSTNVWSFVDGKYPKLKNKAK